MNKNNLNARELAQIKRIAQNVDADYQKVCKLNEKIVNLTKERDAIQQDIDEMEAPVIRKTGGFKSTDLYEKTITPLFNENGTPKVDKEGRQLKATKYVLRYGDNIFPPVDIMANESPSSEEIVEHTEEEGVGAEGGEDASTNTYSGNNL